MLRISTKKFETRDQFTVLPMLVDAVIIDFLNKLADADGITRAHQSRRAAPTKTAMMIYPSWSKTTRAMTKMTARCQP